MYVYKHVYVYALYYIARPNTDMKNSFFGGKECPLYFNITFISLNLK